MILIIPSVIPIGRATMRLVNLYINLNPPSDFAYRLLNGREASRNWHVVQLHFPSVVLIRDKLNYVVMFLMPTCP